MARTGRDGYPWDQTGIRWDPPGWPSAGPVTAARPPTRPGRALAVGCGVLLAVAVAGLPLGLTWAGIAPDVPLGMTADGPVLAEPQPEQFIAADGWFTLLGLGFGGLAAAAVWHWARSVRGPVALLALTLGAVLAGGLAWWLGRQLGLADYQHLRDAAAVGARFGRPPDLRIAEAGWWPPLIYGVPLVPALAAAITYTLVAAWSRFPSLRPEPVRTGPVDWQPPTWSG